MKVYIGYDHRGDKLALKVIEWLLENGYEVNEPFDGNEKDDDYPDISDAVCKSVKKDKGSKGVLICGTGIGVAMAANRMMGIRAVLAQTESDAYFARRHEDANVLALAGGYTDGVMEVKQCSRKVMRMLNTFLTTEYEGGRHDRRVKKLEQLGKNKD